MKENMKFGTIQRKQLEDKPGKVCGSNRAKSVRAVGSCVNFSLWLKAFAYNQQVRNLAS